MTFTGEAAGLNMGLKLAGSIIVGVAAVLAFL